MPLSDSKVAVHEDGEDTALAHMGYEPRKKVLNFLHPFPALPLVPGRKQSLTFSPTELKRSFGLLGMIGFSFSIVTWYAIPQ